MSKVPIMISAGLASLAMLLVIGTGIFYFVFADLFIHSGCQSYTCTYRPNSNGNCRIMYKRGHECKLPGKCPLPLGARQTCYDNDKKMGEPGFCPRETECIRPNSQFIVFIISVSCVGFSGLLFIVSSIIFAKYYFFPDDAEEIRNKREDYELIVNV